MSAATQLSAMNRRAKYQRCHTLATIPAHAIPEVGEELEQGETGVVTRYDFTSKLTPTLGESPSTSRGNSPERPERRSSGNASDRRSSGNASDRRSSGNSNERRSSGNAPDEEYQVLEAITKPAPPVGGAGGAGSGGGSGSGGGGKVKKTRFRDKKLTINTELQAQPQAISTADEHQLQRPMRTLRSPTSPSALLNRMKDKIRQKVFQSSEWSNAAAILHDERQRANTALQASLNSRRDIRLEHIQLHELHKKKSRSKNDSSQVKYDMGVVQPEMSQKGETVRAAFIRRRSISEDTYDRKPCMPKIEEVPQIEPRLLSSIPKPQHHRKVPKFLSRNMRTQSLDSGRMARALVEAHLGMVGYESSTSSMGSNMGSNRTMDSSSTSMDNSALLLNAGRPDYDASGGSARSSFSNTDVILDTKSKETMLNESSTSVSLSGGAGNGGNCALGSSTSSFTALSASKKSDPLEVQYDEHGQTWDVYGAEFDPEVLGNSIQQHLEKLMESGAASEEDRRMSKISCQEEARSSMKNAQRTAEDAQGFWLRLFCLFARRREMAN